MYVKLCRAGAEQIFSFWGYGETKNITPGSGLFVGPTGVALNHHFVLSVQHPSYNFEAGHYSILVFARIVGRSTPIKLDTISLALSKGEANALAGQLGILFELEWDTGKYTGHTRESSTLSRDDELMN